MLFIDIFLIITNPFYPQKARAKYYYIVTVLVMIIQTVANTVDQVAYDNERDN